VSTVVPVTGYSCTGDEGGFAERIPLYKQCGEYDAMFGIVILTYSDNSSVEELMTGCL